MANNDHPENGNDQGSLPTEPFQPIEPEQRKSSGSGQFAHFRILAKLGSGAFGTVYRAHDQRLDREVALKIPTKSYVAVPANRTRFLREAKAAASIQHPNICPVFEVGESGGVPFYSMALLKGGSLREVMERQSRWSERQVVNLIRKLAAALAVAHESGLIHRDLKPENILIDEQKQPVIADFGLAKMTRGQQESLTQTGIVVGTPAYMSPEALRGDEQGPAGDIFSLGVIFYELLCGVRPFAGTQAEVMAKIAKPSWQPTAPEKLRSGLSSAISSLVLRCLSKDLDSRIGSMKELLVELREISKTTLSANAQSGGRQESANDPRLDSLVASLTSLGTNAQSRVVPLSMWLGGSALTAAIVLIGFFALFSTDYGKVRLQLNLDTNDPALTVYIDDTQVDIESLAQEIELPVGSHELVVRRNGNEIQRYTFQVIAGGTTIERLQPPVIAEKIEDDRLAAELFLNAGAAVRLRVDQGESSETLGQRLPASGVIKVLGVRVPKGVELPLATWEQLGTLAHLESLAVEEGARLEPTTIAILEKLSTLNQLTLHSLRGSLQMLEGWRALPRLQKLDLTAGEFLLDESLASVLRSCAELQELNISRSNLRVELLPEAMARGLRVLIAQQTATSDAAAPWLAAHRQLERVDLSQTLISGEILQAIGQSDALLSLDVSRCAMTDRDVEVLPATSRLRSCGLVGTFVTHPAVMRLQERIKGIEVAFEQAEAKSLDRFIAEAVEAAGGVVEWGKVSRLAADTGVDRQPSNAGQFELIGLQLAAADPQVVRWLPLIARLPALRSLSLAKLPIGNESLGGLARATNLQSLSLQGTAVDEQGLLAIAPLQQIQQLEIDAALLSDNLVKELATWDLVSLTLYGNAKYAPGNLQWLPRLPKLTALGLQDIALGDLCQQVPQPIATVKELRVSIAIDSDIEKLSRWTELQRLDVSGTNITDDVFAALTSLTQLQQLNIGKTRIQGTQLDRLKALPLRTLNLDYLPLTGPAIVQLGQLVRLEELTLTGTAADNASLQVLAKMPALKRLDVVDAWTTKSGRESFRTASPQCSLLPADVAGRDASAEVYEWVFQQQGELKVRMLDNTVVVVDNDAELPPGNYRVLGVNLLNSASGIDNDGMRKLSQLIELEELSIYGPACTDASLAQLQELPALRTLTLDHVEMTDRGVRYLLACRQLKSLRIAHAKLTDGSAELLRELPELEFLQLNHSGWTSACLDQLANLPRLAKLDISFPIKENARPLSQIKTLEHLVITECNELSEEDMQLLARMRNVRHLTLRNCRLDDRVRAQFANLKSISLLTLQDLNFAAADWRRLVGMSQLNHLSIRGIPLGRDEVRALLTLEQIRALTLLDCQLDAESFEVIRKWCEKRRIKLVMT